MVSDRTSRQPVRGLALLARTRFPLLPYLLAGPVALYITVVLLYPIGENVYTSFTSTELLATSPPRWVGLANYERLVQDARFWKAVVTTFLYTSVVVVTVITTALAVALLLNRSFVGRWVARGVVILPWAFPEVATVLIWSAMFSQAFGVLNVFVRGVIPLSDNVPWLTDPTMAFVSVTLVTLWKIFPFYSLVLLTALQTVDQHLYEAAKIDGAGPTQAFRHVTLPGIAPTLALMILLLTIWSFRRFAIIYLLTGGGPGGATETLVVQVYNTAFKFFSLSYGATIGMAGLVVSLIITIAYLLVHRRLEVER